MSLSSTSASGDTATPTRCSEQRVPPESRSKATRSSVRSHSMQRSTTGRKPSRARTLRKKPGTTSGPLCPARARSAPSSIWNSCGFGSLRVRADRRLQHRHRPRQAVEVVADGSEVIDRLRLVDDVQLAAALVELQLQVGGRLETGAEAALGLADALGDGPHLAVARREDADDPIGLAELVRPEHDPLVPVQAHRLTVPTEASLGAEGLAAGPRPPRAGEPRRRGWRWPRRQARRARSHTGTDRAVESQRHEDGLPPTRRHSTPRGKPTSAATSAPRRGLPRHRPRGSDGAGTTALNRQLAPAPADRPDGRVATTTPAASSDTTPASATGSPTQRPASAPSGTSAPPSVSGTLLDGVQNTARRQHRRRAGSSSTCGTPPPGPAGAPRRSRRPTVAGCGSVSVGPATPKPTTVTGRR